MGDRVEATQPTQPTWDAIELGSLTGRYSTADDSLPWWASMPLLLAGLAVLLLVGSGEWAGRLGYVLFVAGSLLLAQRYVLRATTEVTADGVNLKGYYGRRTRVPWAHVADVLPSRFPTGRSRVRLADGRRVLLGGVPASKARRLREALRQAGVSGGG